MGIFSEIKNSIWGNENDAVVGQSWDYEEDEPKNLFKESSIFSKIDLMNTIDTVYSGLEFENVVGKLLQDNMFQNVVVTKASGDYGGDVLAEKDGIRYVFQCKKYSNNVGPDAVQQIR